jgi:hypothetical protein
LKANGAQLVVADLGELLTARFKQSLRPAA